ncbi:hypothetical protein Syun_029171 [Stephania yunnanensis]|uniref:Uncharacterized protein n=1 Tax=Stephania yunnanensis TaxID=152371 RepID=A0AAP0E9G0_9MAGN
MGQGMGLPAMRMGIGNLNGYEDGDEDGDEKKNIPTGISMGIFHWVSADLSIVDLDIPFNLEYFLVLFSTEMFAMGVNAPARTARTRIASTVKAIVDERFDNGEVSNK